MIKLIFCNTTLYDDRCIGCNYRLQLVHHRVFSIDVIKLKKINQKNILNV